MTKRGRACEQDKDTWLRLLKTQVRIEGSLGMTVRFSSLIFGQPQFDLAATRLLDLSYKVCRYIAVWRNKRVKPVSDLSDADPSDTQNGLRSGIDNGVVMTIIYGSRLVSK